MSSRAKHTLRPDSSPPRNMLRRHTCVSTKIQDYRVLIPELGLLVKTSESSLSGGWGLVWSGYEVAPKAHAQDNAGVFRGEMTRLRAVT